MNENSKKYFSISEVSKALGMAPHKLRYLEKAKPPLEVFQIRGRRYYTVADIELIKQKLKASSDKSTDLNIVNKIDSLISRLTALSSN